MAWFKKHSVDGKIDSPVDMVKEADAVSRPMAIMVVIAIVLLSASVVFCLFVGGKWVYSQIKPNKKTTAPAVTDKSGQSSPASQPTSEPAKTANTSASNNNTSQPASVPTSGPSELPRSGPE